MTPADVPDELHDLAMAGYYADIEHSLVSDCVDRALAAALPVFDLATRTEIALWIRAQRNRCPDHDPDEGHRVGCKWCWRNGALESAALFAEGNHGSTRGLVLHGFTEDAATRAPRGTGGAHNPGREHGEGSDGCEASQRCSGVRRGEG